MVHLASFFFFLILKSSRFADPNNSSRCIKCEGYCPVKCKGGTIDSFGRINDYLFKRCNVIEGYLEIELRFVIFSGIWWLR